MRYSEICGKEVINISNGSLIGLVSDLEFEVYSYQIEAIFARPPMPFMKKCLPWLFHCEEVMIPVSEIENIAGDVILVRFR